MSHNGLSTETGQPVTSTELHETGVMAAPAEPMQKNGEANGGTHHYTDLQSAARFPIKLPISVKSNSGESRTETQNISSNGVLFCVDAEMPVGAHVDFTILLPADVVGADQDVRVDCRGRVVRNLENDGRRGVGVVIDEYRFERPEGK